MDAMMMRQLLSSANTTPRMQNVRKEPPQIMMRSVTRTQRVMNVKLMLQASVKSTPRMQPVKQELPSNIKCYVTRTQRLMDVMMMFNPNL